MTATSNFSVLVNATLPFLLLGFTSVLYTVIELRRYKQNSKTTWKNKTGKGVKNTVEQDHRMDITSSPLNKDDYQEIGDSLISELNSKSLNLLFNDKKIERGKKGISRGFIIGVTICSFFFLNLILTNNQITLFPYQMELSFLFSVLFGIGMVVYTHRIWGIDVWRKGVLLGNI